MQQLSLVALFMLSLTGVFSQNQISLTNENVYYPSYKQGHVVPDQLKVDFQQPLVYTSSLVTGQEAWAGHINQYPISNQNYGGIYVSPRSNVNQQTFQQQRLPFELGNEHSFQSIQGNNLMDQGAIIQPIQNNLQNLMKPRVLDQWIDPVMDYAAMQPAHNQLDQRNNLQPKQVTKTQPSGAKPRMDSKPVEINKYLQDIPAINSVTVESNTQQKNATMKANDASYQQQIQQEQQLENMIRQERAKLLRIKLQQVKIKIKQEQILKNQIPGSQKSTETIKQKLPLQQSMQKNIPMQHSMQQKKQSNQQFGNSQASISRLGKQTPNLSLNQRNNQQRQSQHQQNLQTQMQQVQSQRMLQMQSRKQLMIQQQQIQQLKQKLQEQIKRQQILEQQQSLYKKRERLQKTMNDRQALQQAGRYVQRRQRIQPINILG